MNVESRIRLLTLTTVNKFKSLELITNNFQSNYWKKISQLVAENSINYSIANLKICTKY